MVHQNTSRRALLGRWRRKIAVFGVALVLAAFAARVDSADPGPEGQSTPLDVAAIQESLIWTGHHNTAADGRMGPQTRESIRAFQRAIGAEPTGVLTPEELVFLTEYAAHRRAVYGWREFRHPVLDYKIGYPAALLDRSEPLPDGGQLFLSSDPRLRLEIRIQPPTSSAEFRDLHARFASPTSREVTYTRLEQSWMVVSGYDGDTTVGFYTRAQRLPSATVRYTMLWPRERTGEFRPIVTAVANSFRVPPDLSPSGGNSAAGKRTADVPPPEEPPRGLPLSEARSRPRESGGPWEAAKSAVWFVIAAPLVDDRPDTGRTSWGTAVAVSSQRLLTRCRFLDGRASIVLYRNDRGATFLPARLAWWDSESDRCVLETPAPALESAARVQSLHDVGPGSRVVFVGASEGGSEMAVREGTATDVRDRKGLAYLQTLPPIPNGASGGLFDEQGDLIGVATAPAPAESLAVAAESYPQ